MEKRILKGDRQQYQADTEYPKDLNVLILKEVDVGLFEEYEGNKIRGNGCKRISYCSCDCDRSTVPFFH